MEFSFYSPVKVIFGQPAAAALRAALTERARSASPLPAASRILLISDPGLAAVGLVDQITGSLTAAGFQVSVFAQVRGNPTVRDVEAALAVALAADAQALVALGGGSVIDVGKAVGLLLTHGGRYADFQWGDRPITQAAQHIPLIAVPTTAGTGSEVTQVTVIEDDETHSKRGVRSPYLFARAAVLDPALTLSLPAHLTAATGVDVVGHALEAFVGRRANPITDALALDALRRAWRNLPCATRQGNDLRAREEMLAASVMAGLAFDQSGLGIIHSLAGPIAGRYALHHGLCVGLLLAAGLEYNLPALGAKREPLLEALGMPASIRDAEVAERVNVWLADLNLPTRLSQLNIHNPDLTSMAQEAARMVLLPNNPRPATADDCRQILEGVA
jgi:alcohol dehydrogenase